MKDTELLELLESKGVDVKGTLDRFMGNEALYVKFLKKFPADPNYKKMEQDLQERNYEELLKSSHALKGLTGNLGLNFLYESLTKMVADIRAAEYDDLDRLAEEIRRNYGEICAELEK